MLHLNCVAYFFMNYKISIDRYKLFVTLLLIVGISFSAFLTYEFWLVQERAEDAAHSEEASVVVNTIQQEIKKNVELLQDGIGLFAASDFVDREEWKLYVRTQLDADNTSGVRAVEYVTYVPASEKETFEKTVREDTTLESEGYPGFKIIPEDEYTEYYVVTYIEPLEGNESAFGLNLGFNEDRLETLERARDTGEVSISAPITLVQEDNRKAVLLALPVYKNGALTETKSDRRNALQGFVVVLAQFDNVFKNFVIEGVDRKLDFELYMEGVSDVLLAQTTDVVSREYDPVPVTRSFELGGRSFRLDFYVIGHGFEFEEHVIAYAVFFGGAILTILVAIIIYLTGRSRRAAVVLAKEMTADLKSATRRIEREKDRVEATLRASEQAKSELEKRTNELEELSSQMVGRELKMVELKNKLKQYEEGKK